MTPASQLMRVLCWWALGLEPGWILVPGPWRGPKPLSLPFPGASLSFHVWWCGGLRIFRQERLFTNQDAVPPLLRKRNLIYEKETVLLGCMQPWQSKERVLRIQSTLSLSRLRG